MHSFYFLTVFLALTVLFCAVFAEEECETITTTITEFTYVTLNAEAETATEAPESTIPGIPAIQTHDALDGVKPPNVGVICGHADNNENHDGCRVYHPTQFSISETDELPTSSYGTVYSPTPASNNSLASSVYAESEKSASSIHSFSVSTEVSTVHVTLTLVRATHSSTHSTPTVSSTNETAYPPTNTSVPFQVSSSTPNTTPPLNFSTSTLSARSTLPTYPWRGSYADKVLYSHNIHRLNHTVANLSWNQTLANAACSWAQRCVFAHNTSSIPGGYGQNLAGSSPTASISQHISDYWYNGEAQLYAPYYGQSNPPNLAAGHFTQVVWKGTGSVGCATVDCRRSSLGMWYTVCNYYPPGNYGGRYASNVFRPIGNPYVKGNASDIITRNSW